MKLYDTLTKKLYVPEDKAKELIIMIYESAEERMMVRNLGLAAIRYEEQQQRYARDKRSSGTWQLFTTASLRLSSSPV